MPTPPPLSVEALAKSAGEKSKLGDMIEAEKLWLAVIELAPNHADANFALGVHAYQRTDLATAKLRFRAALLDASSTAGFRFTISRALKQISDLDGELLALDAALAIDPYHLQSILAKGDALSALGRSIQASVQYSNALKIVGPSFNWPDALRTTLEHAQAFCEAQSKKKEAWFQNTLAEAKKEFGNQDWLRFDEGVSILAGRTKAFHQEPIMFSIPRLPAETFYKREQFEALEIIEAKTDEIRKELENLLVKAPQLAKPYVQYEPGQPVNQWHDLNHSDTWSGIFLWKNGQLQEEAAALCPITVAAFSAVPMPQIRGYSPTVMFSLLAPGAHIPPHTGDTNARLVGHLPLIVPPDCHFRVGYDWRQWEVGTCMIFDDTIEHEALNKSAENRVVVLFDLWNPYLTAPERALTEAILVARTQYVDA
jgi:aspartate beta-hydroxylase